MTVFTELELEYLAGQRLGRLATQKPNGTLQVSPVGFSYNAELDTIDISGFNMSASRKYRNVADNGRVAFVVDDLYSERPWRVRCLEIRGDGSVVGELIRIKPTRVISFGLDLANVPAHEMASSQRDV